MLSINGTFLVVMVSFVIFMLTMRAVFFEPVARIKAARAAKLSGDQDHAKAATAQMADLQGNYEDQLRKARGKAQALVASLQTQARQEASATVQKAKQKAQDDLDKRMVELAQWREETYQRLASDRDQLVKTIIHKISGSARVPAGE